ncbi:amyloid-beta A4 precursor protein-binding family B member 3 isoform X2 [Stigmatopora nigra]
MMGKDYMLAIIIVNCDDNIWGDRNFLPDPDLPCGWRTVRDSAGTYYWHVPSGTTQWRHPGLDGATPQSARADAVPTDGGPRAPDDDDSESFSVRSLGWLQVEEDDLAPGRGGLALGDAIRRLSHPAGPSGEGRQLRLLLKRGTLHLLDPLDHAPLYCQPMGNIRVWGVGGGGGGVGGDGHGRDFAFVAADKDSCVLKCHVFRCDAPARAIAGALQRACSQMMSQQTSRSLSADGISLRDRPAPVEFPQTGPESVRVFDVHYVGNLPVSRAMGMEVLNLAIESIVNGTRRHEWEAAVIHVTDTFLSVFKPEGEEPMWACQVRFLSFLGVGHDDRTFAVIADGGRQRFECHVFWCRPDAGPLSEAVQASCMVQYQKCLVAQTPPPRSRARRQAPPKIKRANSVDDAAFQSGEAPRKGSGLPRRGMMAFLDTLRNKRAGAR